MSDELPLYPAASRAKGEAEIAVEQLLAAWADLQQPRLVGVEHEPERVILLDLARAVDRARADLGLGRSGAAYGLARVAAMLRDALDSYATTPPPQKPDGGETDASHAAGFFSAIRTPVASDDA